MENKLLESIKNKTKLNYDNLFIFFTISFNLAYLINKSWMRWSDVQIDYGRELYVSWRMSLGDKMLIDFEDLYGPFPRIFDLFVFKITKANLVSLEIANFLIYISILIILFKIIQFCWNKYIALMACIVFLQVFSFAQLSGTSNYNFITPYTQSVNLGYLNCIILLYILITKKYNFVNYFYIGLLVGTSFVIKPEFMLCAILGTIVSFFIKTYKIDIKCISIFLIGVITPSTLILIYYYLNSYDISYSLRVTSNAWLSVFHAMNNNMIYGGNRELLGLNSPMGNFLKHVFYTLIAVFLVITSLVVAYLSTLKELVNLRYTILIIFYIGILFLSFYVFNWGNIGKSFLGILIVYIFYTYYINKNNICKIHYNNRFIFVVFAVLLMFRMLLNGRIYQYGFYQASLAGTVVAVLMLEEPVIYLSSKSSRLYYRLFVISILLIGVLKITRASNIMYDYKTYLVGESYDSFYTYRTDLNKTGDVVNHFTNILKARPKSETLLVAPEGLIINYLAKLKNPVPYMDCIPRGEKLDSILVSELKRKPPTWILFISRDLTEFGINEFGSDRGKGKELVSWAFSNYEIYEKYGDEPFTNGHIGGILLKYKN
jgi:hypothetical protein